MGDSVVHRAGNDQGGLRRPTRVDRWLAGAGPVSNSLNAELGPTPVAELGPRCFKDGAFKVGAASAASAGLVVHGMDVASATLECVALVGCPVMQRHGRPSPPRQGYRPEMRFLHPRVGKASPIGRKFARFRTLGNCAVAKPTRAARGLPVHW